MAESCKHHDFKCSPTRVRGSGFHLPVDMFNGMVAKRVSRCVKCGTTSMAGGVRRDPSLEHPPALHGSARDVLRWIDRHEQRGRYSRVATYREQRLFGRAVRNRGWLPMVAGGATRFWVGSGTNWSSTASWSATTGGASGASVPTTVDDAILDVNSPGNCIIDGTPASQSTCRNLDCTGFTHTLVLGNTNQIGVFGTVLKLVASMTFTAQGTISCQPAASTVMPVTTAGLTMPGSFGLNGAGTVQFQDTFTTTASGRLNVNGGNLDTNNQTCTWNSFSTATTGTISLGTSSITMLGASLVNVFVTTGATNLTFTANSATIIFTGTSAGFTGGAFNHNGLSLSFTGGGSMGLFGNTATGLRNLTVTGTAAKADNFSFAQSYTFSGTVTLNGNSTVNRLFVYENSGPGMGQAAGRITLIINGSFGASANVDFQDLNFAGTAGVYSGTSFGDCQGNGGITFPASTTQTWSGTVTGNWSDVTKWTSRVPLPQDDVLISGLTAGSTIVMDMQRAGRTISFAGSTGGSLSWVPSSSGIPNIYGSLTLASGLTVSGGANMTFAGQGNQTVDNKGISHSGNVVFNGGASSTYTLLSDFGSQGNTGLQLQNCTLDANGHNCTFKAGFVVTNNTTAVLKMGSGTWTVNGTGAGGQTTTPVNIGANCTVQPGTSTILLTDTGAAAKGFIGAGKAFNNVTIAGGGTGAWTFSGNNTLNTLTIGPPKTVTFTAGQTTTVTQLVAIGTSGNLITLNSATPGSTWTIKSASSTITCDYLVLQDSTATGGATFIAGNHSTNVSNNIGWIFATAPPAANVISVSRAVSVLVRPVVDWRWVLCKSSDMTEITELAVHDRSLQMQLDNQGKASGWTHLLDPSSQLIVPHQTALRLDRNEETVWSGKIWQANDDSSSGTDKCSITAFGWFNELGGSGDNGRLVHTGAEFQAMLAAPNGVLWVAQNGAYVPLGIDGATQLAYSASQFPQTTDAAIIFDLLNRANIDAPTLITPGTVHGTPFQRNLTLQRFQNVGQEILQLVNTESGVDFEIDPVTREMNLWAAGASGTPLIGTGRGVDRGAGMLFSYPGNCIAASRPRDGTKTQNRFEIIGQYGVGRADDVGSQSTNGLLEGTQSLSEVVDPNILIAYAQAQILVMSQPWTIVSFTPRAVTAEDSSASGVPRPFDDYDLGDIVYAQINRGSMKVGMPNPQPVRVFGFTINIDDDGIEKVSQVQTSYQGL